MPSPGADIPIEELIEASHRPEVIEAVRGFYKEVDRRIAEYAPTCWNSGACCRFGEYGHRLYVTALEVAYYLAQATGESIHRGQPREREGSAERRLEVPPLPHGRGSDHASRGSDHASRGSDHAGRGADRSGFGSDQAAPHEAGQRLLQALPVLIPPIVSDSCPHAFDRRCHVRDRRPLGCRIFHCDPGAQSWQGPFTEECLQELKRLHRELAVSYLYVDWMTVLRSLQRR